jgi:hypothetical protein
MSNTSAPDNVPDGLVSEKSLFPSPPGSVIDPDGEKNIPVGTPPINQQTTLHSVRGFVVYGPSRDY